MVPYSQEYTHPLQLILKDNSPLRYERDTKIEHYLITIAEKTSPPQDILDDLLTSSLFYPKLSRTLLKMEAHLDIEKFFAKWKSNPDFNEEAYKMAAVLFEEKLPLENVSALINKLLEPPSPGTLHALKDYPEFYKWYMINY